MKRRLNARLWSVLLGLLMAVLAPVGALAEYVPSAADCFWASHEAAAYGLSTEDVVWMLENGKTRSEIETALCNARPLSQYATGAAEYLDLARKWNVPSGEAIDAYKIGLEIGANPEAYLYAVAQGRSPEEAQAALRRYVGARKAVQSLGVLGNVEIPGDIEIEDVQNTNASGVPRGDAGPAAWVIRPMTVGPYSARSSSTVGALAAGGSAVWCTLEDRRSAVAHAIASVYSLPAHDNPEGFVLELLGKGLSTEEALSVMFTLDCA